MSWQDKWIHRWKEQGLSEDEFPWDELPVVHPNEDWEVLHCWRRTAEENRPGLKKFYITVLDADGEKLGGVILSFNIEPPRTGVIYDHPNIYGRSGETKGRKGFAEWEHLGKPTRYRFFVEGMLLIENLRTDLGYEYCKPFSPLNWRPINRPGVYSYDIVIKSKRLRG